LAELPMPGEMVTARIENLDLVVCLAGAADAAPWRRSGNEGHYQT